MKPPGAYDVVGHIEKASSETQDACRLTVRWLWYLKMGFRQHDQEYHVGIIGIQS